MDSSNGTTKAGTQDAKPQGKTLDELRRVIDDECGQAAGNIVDAFGFATTAPLIFRLANALVATARATLGKLDDQPQDEYGVGIPVVARGPAGLNLPTIREHEDYAKALAQQALMAGHWMKEAKSWEAEAREAEDRAHKAKQEKAEASDAHRADLRELDSLLTQIDEQYRFTDPGCTVIGAVAGTLGKLQKAARGKDAGKDAGGRREAQRDQEFPGWRNQIILRLLTDGAGGQIDISTPDKTMWWSETANRWFPYAAVNTSRLEVEAAAWAAIAQCSVPPNILQWYKSPEHLENGVDAPHPAVATAEKKSDTAQTAAAGTAEDPIAEVQRMAFISEKLAGDSRVGDSHFKLVPAQTYASLMESIARLSAGKVGKPATLHKRSQDASTNELATGIAGADVITDAEGQQWTHGQAPEPQP